MRAFTFCVMLGVALVALTTVSAVHAADTGSAYESLILSMSPEHYFPLDETSGASGVTNLGTNTNALGAGSHVGGLLSFDHGGAFNATGVFPGIPGVDDRTRTMSLSGGDTTDGHHFDTNVTTTGTAGRDFRPNMGSGNLALGAYGGTALTGVDFGPGSSSIMPNIGTGANADGHENAMTIVAWVMTDSFGDGGFGGNPSRQGRLFQSELNVTGSGINLTGSGSPVLAPAGTGTGASAAGPGVGFDHGDSPFGNQERAYQNGSWQLWIFSTHGTTDNQRLQNTRAWTRWAEKTNETGVQAGLGVSDPTHTVIGGRFANNTAGAQWDGGVDEIAIYTRVLHHNEMEKIYVTGSATSTSPLTSTTTASGFMQVGFGAAGATSAVDGFAYPVVGGGLGPLIWGASGTWINNGNAYAPSQHGLNNQERLRRVIAHDVDLVHSHVRDTRTERVAAYSWEIKSGASLNIHDNATVVRSFEDITINGGLTLNGTAGSHGPEGDDAHHFYNFNLVDSGRDLLIGAGANISLRNAHSNLIRAEENITFSSGTLTVGDDGVGKPVSGAGIVGTIMRANYDEVDHYAPLLVASGPSFPGPNTVGGQVTLQRGASSTDYVAGVLTGAFAVENLPVDETTALARRWSVLYENAAAGGAGTVNAVKVGLARPGDADFDGSVGAVDLLAASPLFGLSLAGVQAAAAGSRFDAGQVGRAASWREGNWNNSGGSKGVVDAIDLLDSSPFFNATYGSGVSLSGDVTTAGQNADGNPSICYDYTTGEVIIDTDGNTTNTYVLDSLAGIFTGLPPVFIGGTFFQTDNDFRIAENFHTNLNGVHNLGAVAQAGLTLGFLLNDLTLQGGSAGNPNFQFDLVVKNTPEPSTIVLIGLGLLGVVGAAWRRRRRA